MNEREKLDWYSIVESCKSSDLRSINVGSKTRREAIIAAHDDLVYWKSKCDYVIAKITHLFDVESYE